MPLRNAVSGTGHGGGLRRALGLYPDATLAQFQSDLNHMAAIGIQAVWEVVALEVGFPSSTTIDSGWATRWSQIATEAKTRNLKVILQAHGNPGWNVTAGGHTDTTPPWHHPDNATERGNWVTMLHNAVVAIGPAQVDYVEIWNESNIVEFAANGVSAADTARLLHDSYLDLTTTWPWIRVVGLNMSRNHFGWLELVYDQLQALYTEATCRANGYFFHVLGIHPYAGDATSGWAHDDTSHADETTALGLLGPDYPDFKRFLFTMMGREGTIKPVAFGEVGYATLGSGYFKTTEANRAAWLAGMVKLARDSPDLPVEYITAYYHFTQDTPVDYASSFNVHGASSETAFGAA